MTEDNHGEDNARLAALKNEHQKLDKHISTLLEDKLIDYLEMKNLKIRKLQIKDEITLLESILPDDIA